MTTALTINYNTPDYLERLLVSFRKPYPLFPYLVIDGSDEEHYNPIKDFDKRFNIELLHFNYNIHHGPGMAYGIDYIKSNRILLVDSDIIILSGGLVEMMDRELRNDSYGIGNIQEECYFKNTGKGQRYKNRRGRVHASRRNKNEKIVIRYLHPVFALINRDVALRFPMPVKGGAPLLPAMKVIHTEGLGILQNSAELTDDLFNHKKRFIQHNGDHAGMGTVVRTGGYHLD